MAKKPKNRSTKDVLRVKCISHRKLETPPPEGGRRASNPVPEYQEASSLNTPCSTGSCPLRIEDDFDSYENTIESSLRRLVAEGRIEAMPDPDKCGCKVKGYFVRGVVVNDALEMILIEMCLEN